jgi:hypothetical protein
MATKAPPGMWSGVGVGRPRSLFLTATGALLFLVWACGTGPASSSAQPGAAASSGAPAGPAGGQPGAAVSPGAPAGPAGGQPGAGGGQSQPVRTSLLSALAYQGVPLNSLEVSPPGSAGFPVAVDCQATATEVTAAGDRTAHPTAHAGATEKAVLSPPADDDVDHVAWTDVRCTGAGQVWETRGTVCTPSDCPTPSAIASGTQGPGASPSPSRSPVETGGSPSPTPTPSPTTGGGPSPKPSAT